MNRQDPTAVATAAITAAFSIDTTRDSSALDAQNRALIWYTPTAAAKVLAGNPTLSSNAQWSTWTAHHAKTAVTVQPNNDPGAPPDTGVAAYRQFNVIVTPHGTDGWTAPASQYQCFATLSRTSTAEPWQIANLQVDQ